MVIGSPRSDSISKLEQDGDFSSAHIGEVGTTEAQYEIHPVIDKRVTRKFDLHILFGIWLFAFIDRSNIGNAKIDGLVEDSNLTGNKFNIALTVFMFRIFVSMYRVIGW
jgi:hypothetical protein